MDRMLVESAEQQSRTMSSICSSIQNTTLGDGVHACTLTSSFASSSKLANSSSCSLLVTLWRAFFTCLPSLGNSAVSSQSSTQPTFMEVSSKILEGPLRPAASSTSVAFVDGAVGTSFFPDRGCL